MINFNSSLIFILSIQLSYVSFFGLGLKDQCLIYGYHHKSRYLLIARLHKSSLNALSGVVSSHRGIYDPEHPPY
jgi:hypothetical protein